MTELETAQLYASNTMLKALVLFRLLTSSAGIVCMALLQLNKKKFVACKSLKTLLNLHGIWTSILCLSTFAESAERMHAFLTVKDPMDLLLTPHECLIRMTPQFFGICGSITSMLVMSFERFEASRKLSTYEASSDRSGTKFVVIHLLLTFAGVYVDGCKYDFPTRVAQCSAASVGGMQLQAALSIFFFLSAMFTIFLCCMLLRRNERVQASEMSLNLSLSERYQLTENVRVLRLLLPIVISHTSITMAGAVGFLYFEYAGYRKEIYPIFENVINMVYLQGIAMPLIFLNRQRNKRSTESRLFAMNKYSGEQLIALYDMQITRRW